MNNFPVNGVAACSGVEGSNAQAACMKFFPEGRILYVDSFKAVLDAVKSGRTEYGVLPIENSFNGSVREVYNLIARYRFFIVRSLLLPIRHCLLAKHGTSLKDIRQIYSHPQAIGQCSEFLGRVGIETVSFWNTAGAAKMVGESQDGNLAAIASPLCAELYGLECIESDIQDSSDNYTKFICVQEEPVMYSESDHMSLIVGCENKPGTLSAVLSKISEYGVNMNKIESCPRLGHSFEYIFFIELEADIEDSRTSAMLEDVKRAASDFIFLGSYKLI